MSAKREMARRLLEVDLFKCTICDNSATCLKTWQTDYSYKAGDETCINGILAYFEKTYGEGVKNGQQTNNE